MPIDTPTASRRLGRYTPARFLVRVGSDWCPVRAATIRPIADALDVDDVLEPPPAAAAGETSSERLMLDLIDSGMIAPPRPRRRRERPVSSRAVFFQAADA